MLPLTCSPSMMVFLCDFKADGPHRGPVCCVTRKIFLRDLIPVVTCAIPQPAPTGPASCACEKWELTHSSVHARRVWKKTALQTLNSRFHMDVSEKLHFMGIPHEDEFVTEDGLFSIDVAVTGPGGPVAIEVDGPYHFTINTLNPLGSTLIR